MFENKFGQEDNKMEEEIIRLKKAMWTTDTELDWGSRNGKKSKCGHEKLMVNFVDFEISN